LKLEMCLVLMVVMSLAVNHFNLMIIDQTCVEEVLEMILEISLTLGMVPAVHRVEIIMTDLGMISNLADMITIMIEDDSRAVARVITVVDMEILKADIRTLDKEMMVDPAEVVDNVMVVEEEVILEVVVTITDIKEDMAIVMNSY